jgi:hypothetical protein
MRDRHWRALGVACHWTALYPPPFPRVPFGMIVALRPHAYAASVKGVIDAANRESKVSEYPAIFPFLC